MTANENKNEYKKIHTPQAAENICFRKRIFAPFCKRNLTNSRLPLYFFKKKNNKTQQQQSQRRIYIQNNKFHTEAALCSSSSLWVVISLPFSTRSLTISKCPSFDFSDKNKTLNSHKAKTSAQ